MKIKHYYIISKAVWESPQENNPERKNFDLFDSGGSHYLNLNDSDQPDLILVCGDFRDEGQEDKFSKLSSCAPLPHPTLQGHEKLDKDKHVKKLKGVLSIDENSTVIDVIKQAGAKHPLMKIGGFK